jgi:cell division protein FtsI (penicillin-binding protein 3)
MNVGKKKWIRFRIYLVGIFFVAGLGAILARAYQLQILEQDRLKAIARCGYVGTIKLPPKRGTIYDREGHELALSVEVGSIYAHPKRIKKKDEAARKLSQVLNESQGNFLSILNRKSPFVWIKRKIAPDEARKVVGLGLEGVGMTTETRRYYPGKEIAAHLVGFTGADNQGLEGIEKKYDGLLRGPHTSLIQMRDAMGRPFAISRPIPSGHGGMKDIILTIDKDIQYKAQEALRSAVNKARARAGHCLVLDPMTGEILAMAVVPEFNPNIFSKYKPYQWRNRIITDCFEPGSTMKAFLLAASLEESVVTPNTNFDCENGRYRIDNHVIHDTHKHGVMSVSDIVVHSSNIGAIKVGQKLGYTTFCKYLKNFGFGDKTDIDLLGERNGFVRPANEARTIDKATIFFGQGMTTTSLQLAVAMGAIANGGKLMRPYVVKSVVDESGRTVEQTYPKMVRRVLSSETAEKVTRILELVASDKGTAPEAAITGFKVAGKTGTSQKVDPKTKRYSTDKYVAIFVGFVPVNQPRLVILVMVDEPKGIVYGGVVSAPAFREIGLWSLNHLRVNPQIRLVDKGVDVQEDIKKEPDPDLVKHNDLRIKVGLLPDFRGLGMREVTKKGRSLGLKVLLEGTGLAVEQEPGPGSPIQEVHTVRVRFRPPA